MPLVLHLIPPASTALLASSSRLAYSEKPFPKAIPSNAFVHKWAAFTLVASSEIPQSEVERADWARLHWKTISVQSPKATKRFLQSFTCRRIDQPSGASRPAPRGSPDQSSGVPRDCLVEGGVARCIWPKNSPRPDHLAFPMSVVPGEHFSLEPTSRPKRYRSPAVLQPSGNLSATPEGLLDAGNRFVDSLGCSSSGPDTRPPGWPSRRSTPPMGSAVCNRSDTCYHRHKLQRPSGTAGLSIKQDPTRRRKWLRDDCGLR